MHQVLELVDDLQRRAEVDFQSVLREINETTVESVPGARYAGVTFIDDKGRVGTFAATHSYPRQLDDIQRDTGEGPCLSAAWSQSTILVDFRIGTTMHWPKENHCQGHHTD